MKFVIIGYNCSGKSFFSKKLSASLNIALLHIDDVYYDYSVTPQAERNCENVKKDVLSFTEANDSWVMDGGYDNTGLYECCRAADHIIFMRINRFSRLINLCRRYRIKNNLFYGMRRVFKSLPWLLHYGCGGKYDAENYSSIHDFPNKVVVLRTVSEAQKYFDMLIKTNRNA